MSKKTKKFTLKTLTAAAMLAALSAVIGILCKNFFTFNIYYRITFENMPVILAGLLFGSVTGAAVGASADIISCLCSTNPNLNPIITLGAASVGALAGIVPYIIKNKGKAQTALAVVLAHLVGQVGIKSVGKMVYFGMPWQGILVGLLISVFVGAFEFWLINWLRFSRGVGHYLEGKLK